MKKKAIMALMLTAALVLTPILGELSMTVNAAESVAAPTEEGTAAENEAASTETVTTVSDNVAVASVSGNEAGEGSAETTDKIKLEAPTGLQWDERGVPVWNAVENAERYEFELYKDGECVRPSVFLSAKNEGETLSYLYATGYIERKGNYQFRVRSRAKSSSGNELGSEFSESPVYSYVKPKKSLGIATCYWSDTKPGTICWMPVRNADKCGWYYIVLYKNGGMVGEAIVSPEVLECDLSATIEKKGVGKYQCMVRAFSSDIEVVAHGTYGECSEDYNTDPAAEPVSSTISSAIKNTNAEKAVEEIKEISPENLRAAMQKDEAVVNQMQDLESRYAAQQNITVNPPTVSGGAGEYVDAEKISVVGAGLNAASGQTVGLEVSIPEEKVETDYAKSVQLDIRLTGEGESVRSLNIPVTITIPLPRGLDAEHLVILHYKEKNQSESVNFKCSSDGIVTFTVSSFSTFVFAEQNPADGGEDNTPSSGDSDGNTSSGSDSSDGNTSSGSDDDNSSAGDSGAGGSDFTANLEDQIRAAAKNGTVKLTDITTLSNGMMKALLERKDVTLVMEYTYGGKNYTVVIPAGAAVDNDIPWYGPLYLAGHYGNSGSYAAGSGSSYVVKKGDTMSKIAKVNRMTLAQLAAKNPQIRNINIIRVGQKINL